ncbi:MAG: hypothetical protein GWN82_21775, partial [Gemmatimonadetes bacterium]|nr:hypothetical protein [Gemmatimonadota bacterium]
MRRPPSSPRTFTVATLLVALAACGPGDADRPPTGTEGGWIPEAYEPRTDDGIQILVIHDMEGLSGQSDPSSFDYGTDLYPRG